MRISPRLAHGPNTVNKPAKVDPKVLELCSWAAHQFCYGSFVGLGTSNVPGCVGTDSQHLNLEPIKGIRSKLHRFGPKGVREGKVLTQWIRDLRWPSGLRDFLEKNPLIIKLPNFTKMVLDHILMCVIILRIFSQQQTRQTDFIPKLGNLGFYSADP